VISLVASFDHDNFKEKNMRLPVCVVALRLRNILYTLAIVCLLASLPVSISRAGASVISPDDPPEFKITKTEYILTLNTKQKQAPLEVEPASFATDSTARAPYNITVSALPKPEIATFDQSNFTITAVAVGTTQMEISYKSKPDSAEKKAVIKITVQLHLEDIEVKLSGLSSDNKISFVEKQKKNITVTLKGTGNEIINGDFEINSDAKTVKLDKTGTQNTLEAVKVGSETITIKAKGKTENAFDSSSKVEKSIQVEVKEAIASVDVKPLTISIKQGDSFIPTIKLIGTSGKEFTPSERPIKGSSNNSSLIKVDDSTGRISAIFGMQTLNQTLNESRTVDVTYVSPEGAGARDTLPGTIRVTVYPRGQFITFSQPSLVLAYGGGSGNVTATVRKEDGKPILDAVVTWELVDNDIASQYIALSSDGNTVTVLALDKPEELPKNSAGVKIPSHRTTFKVKASYTLPNSSVNGTIQDVVTGEFLVRLVEVASFSPLRVRLNIMDDRSAADLYGQVTANEYYVAQVRIFNNLQNSTNKKLTGASILAFSASIEVAVGLEKKYDKSSHSAVVKPENENLWYAVDKQDLKSMVDPMPVKTQADPPDPDANAAQAPDQKETSEQEKERKEKADFPCRSMITYRPLAFEMVVNTVDRRDDRSVRSRVFKGLNAFGTAFSFVTAIAQPGPNSDLPIGLEKYSNLFIPGLEKLWPSLKESYRQNIVSQTMKPIEEVPFGSDISRVLFLPKKPIRGMLRGNLLRISQICPYFFKVEVAVIDKGNKATVTTGTAPQ
jgi:hypothetical protein